jgi:hypothetical protein
MGQEGEGRKVNYEPHVTNTSLFIRNPFSAEGPVTLKGVSSDESIKSMDMLSDGSVISMDVPSAKCVNAPSDESGISKDVQSNKAIKLMDVPGDGFVDKSMDVLSHVSMPFVVQYDVDDSARAPPVWTGEETAGDYNLPTKVKVCLCMMATPAKLLNSFLPVH